MPNQQATTPNNGSIPNESSASLEDIIVKGKGISWSKDGKLSVIDHKTTSMQVLMEWFTKPVNFKKYRGGKQTKEKVCQEILQYFYSKGIKHRTAKMINMKLDNLITSFRKADRIRTGSGQGVLHGVSEEGSDSDDEVDDSDVRTVQELVRCITSYNYCSVNTTASEARFERESDDKHLEEIVFGRPDDISGGVSPAHSDSSATRSSRERRRQAQQGPSVVDVVDHMSMKARLDEERFEWEKSNNERNQKREDEKLRLEKLHAVLDTYKSMHEAKVLSDEEYKERVDRQVEILNKIK
ncbi:hypothetical protein BD770DRAFT_416584 [Pilaira anomala]|nr:hypothetical protein BD770DRAFT_416584 [Pilaira anomala]